MLSRSRSGSLLFGGFFLGFSSPSSTATVSSKRVPLEVAQENSSRIGHPSETPESSLHFLSVLMALGRSGGCGAT